MADVKIHHLVVEGGKVNPIELHVKPGERIWWHPGTSKTKVEIDFDKFEKTPIQWGHRKAKLPGKSLKGTVRQSEIKLGEVFKYKPGGSTLRSGPAIIVDSGLSRKRRRAKRAKR